jgi:hypothetical protein
MGMSQSPLVTAADYADALLTSRRARTCIFWLILIMLLGQLALFFAARYTAVLSRLEATTQPAIASRISAEMLHYFVGLSTFLGVILAILMSVVLLLIINIMLVGRLVGLAHITGAFIWSLLLILLLFPWQGFLASGNITVDFRIPGVLYTWTELLRDARFGIGETRDMPYLFLKWARFVGFPVVAILLLVYVQLRSRTGLRRALGEDEPDQTGRPQSLRT